MTSCAGMGTPALPQEASSKTGPRSSSAFVLTVWLAVMGITSLPYVMALVNTPPGGQYVGLVDKVADGLTYFSKMRQGWEGKWLFENRYSYQAHQPVLLYTFFLALGHVARWSDLSLVAVYHFARILFSLLMLGVVFRFYREWLPQQKQRTLALVLFAFSSGLGWLLPGCELETWVRQQSVDLWMPEAVPFYAMMISPLFCFSLALMVFVLATLLHLMRDRQSAHDMWAIPAFVLLALVHPYDIIPLEVLLIAGLLLKLWHRKGTGSLSFWMLLGLSPIPVILYEVYVFRTNPAMHGWMLQNRTPSSHIVWYLTAYAPLIVFALVAVLTRESRSLRNSPAFLWLLLGIPIAYLPVAFQRRMIMGWTIPLAGFAAVGIWKVLDHILADNPARRRLALLVTCSALSLTNLLLVWRVCAVPRNHPDMIYLTRSEATAMRRLDSLSNSDETVLTSPRLGLLVPALAGNRVLTGHWSETGDFYRMCGVANDFLSSTASSSYRSQVIRDYGIRWVLSDKGALPEAESVPLTCYWRSGKEVLYRCGTRGT